MGRGFSKAADFATELNKVLISRACRCSRGFTVSVHLDDVLAGDLVHVALAEPRQQVVFEQADIGVPRAFVGLDVGHVLLFNEGSEGGDLLGLLLLFARVLPHGDLVAGLVGKCPSLRQ